jgi:hypothetical protein
VGGAFIIPPRSQPSRGSSCPRRSVPKRSNRPVMTVAHEESALVENGPIVSWVPAEKGPIASGVSARKGSDPERGFRRKRSEAERGFWLKPRQNPATNPATQRARRKGTPDPQNPRGPPKPP